jgi:hypothetical protein
LSADSADAADAPEACPLAAFGVVRAAAEAVPRLRTELTAPRGEPFPPSLLRQSDEQTVVGLAALLRAVHDFGLRDQDFTDWGVVAAPRYFGRPLMAAALAQFQVTGPPGVSPLIIPHRSLHALSGTISLALGLHGPNFGAGGGPGALADGLLAALALAREEQVPGLWLVLTEWDPEPSLDTRGKVTRPASCLGVALALGPCRLHEPGPRLGLRRAGPVKGEAVSLAGLAAALTGRRRWSCRLDGGLRVELTLEGMPRQTPPARVGTGGTLPFPVEATR